MLGLHQARDRGRERSRLSVQVGGLNLQNLYSRKPTSRGYETCAIFISLYISLMWFDYVADSGAVADVADVAFVMVSVVSLFNLELRLLNFPLMSETNYEILLQFLFLLFYF